MRFNLTILTGVRVVLHSFFSLNNSFTYNYGNAKMDDFSILFPELSEVIKNALYIAQYYFKGHVLSCPTQLVHTMAS